MHIDKPRLAHVQIAAFFLIMALANILIYAALVGVRCAVS